MIDTFGNAALQGSPVPQGPAVPIGQTPTQVQNTIQATGQQPVPSPYQKPPIEPTTLYSGNINEKVIPDLTNRLKQMETGGVYTGQDGYQYHSDGSPVQAPLDSQFGEQGYADASGKLYKDAPAYVQGDDEDSIQQNSLLQGMKKNLDATSLATISSIEQNANVLKSQQADANARAEKAGQRALLLGGSSRNAPLNAAGNNLITQSYGIQQMAALDSQEKTALAQARQAQQQGNYQLMQSALTLAETKRKEKQDQAVKIADEQRKLIQTNQEKSVKASREGAIADLYAQGITDPATILNLVNYDQAGKLIGDFTTDEIAGVLKNIVPAGLDDLVKTLRQNGAPADVIAKVTQSKDLASAYNAAGNYASGGTGIVGEYNYARANGYTGSFSDYQNEDANRKARSTTGGDRTLSVTEALALGVPFGTMASAAYGFTPQKPPTAEQSTTAIYADRTSQANSIIENLAKDITKMGALDFAAQVGVEPYALGNTLVTDTIRQERQAERNFVNAVLRRESGASISSGEFSSAEKQYFPRPGDDKKTLEQKAQNRGTALSGLAKAAGSAWDGTNTADSVLNTEDKAKQAVVDYGKTNPDAQQHIRDLAGTPQESLGGRAYTWGEIKDILGIK